MRHDQTWAHPPRKPRLASRIGAAVEKAAWISIPITAVTWLVAQVIAGVW